jgi:hypothetical protein
MQGTPESRLPVTHHTDKYHLSNGTKGTERLLPVKRPSFQALVHTGCDGHYREWHSIFVEPVSLKSQGAIYSFIS